MMHRLVANCSKAKLHALEQEMIEIQAVHAEGKDRSSAYLTVEDGEAMRAEIDEFKKDAARKDAAHKNQQKQLRQRAEKAEQKAEAALEQANAVDGGGKGGGKGDRPKCYYCGFPGHQKHACQKRIKDAKAGVQAARMPGDPAVWFSGGGGAMCSYG